MVGESVIVGISCRQHLQRELSLHHPIATPTPLYLEEGSGWSMGPSNQLPPRHTLPPPSPSWAEVAGGGRERRGQLPSAVHSTPPPHHALRPSPSPSAISQFEAWLRCREEGCPAKLVLETDWDSEEVSFWFRRTVCACTEAAPTDAGPPRGRQHKPGRERVRRQGQAERQKAAQSNAPPTSVVVTAARDIGLVPPAASMEVSSPQGRSPPAKRPRTIHPRLRRGSSGSSEPLHTQPHRW